MLVIPLEMLVETERLAQKLLDTLGKENPLRDFMAIMIAEKAYKGNSQFSIVGLRGFLREYCNEEPPNLFEAQVGMFMIDAAKRMSV